MQFFYKALTKSGESVARHEVLKTGCQREGAQRGKENGRQEHDGE